MLGTWCRLAWAALVIYPMVIIREQWEKLNQVYPYIQTLSIEDIFLLKSEGQQAPEPRLQRGFKSDESVVSFKSTLIEWKLPLDWSQAVFIRYKYFCWYSQLIIIWTIKLFRYCISSILSLVFILPPICFCCQASIIDSSLWSLHYFHSTHRQKPPKISQMHWPISNRI